MPLPGGKKGEMFSPWGGLIDTGMLKFTAEWVRERVIKDKFAEAMELSKGKKEDLEGALDEALKSAPDEPNTRRLEQLLVDVGLRVATHEFPKAKPHPLSIFFLELVDASKKDRKEAFKDPAPVGADGGQPVHPWAVPPSPIGSPPQLKGMDVEEQWPCGPLQRCAMLGRAKEPSAVGGGVPDKETDSLRGLLQRFAGMHLSETLDESEGGGTD